MTQSKSASYTMGSGGLQPCPSEGGSLDMWFDLFIPADAESPSQRYTGPSPLCPGATVEIRYALIPAGGSDPNGYPNPSPPAGSQTARMYIKITNPPGSGEPGGQTDRSFGHEATWTGYP